VPHGALVKEFGERIQVALVEGLVTATNDRQVFICSHRSLLSASPLPSNEKQPVVIQQRTYIDCDDRVKALYEIMRGTDKDRSAAPFRVTAAASV
jgi:hypothetical protein